MNARYYCQQLLQGTTATLAEAEAHHLLHVMRAKPGDEVTLFDGRGRECQARVALCGRRSVDLEILSAAYVDRESPREITIGVALPKGDRQRFLIEKCVELGVSRIVPLVTEHSVVAPRPAALERLRRNVIESSKQCGRNQLMQITDPIPLADFLQDGDVSADRFLAHPGQEMATTDFSGDVPIRFAVGPEGGFADRERTQAIDGGWKVVHLGPRILRIETAVIAVAARCL